MAGTRKNGVNFVTKIMEQIIKRRKMKIAICRPINGIPINGVEYLIDGDGEAITFETEEKARRFLKDCGFSEEDIEDMGIEFEDLEQEDGE